MDQEGSGTARKLHSAEQIVNKLREAEVHISQGMTVKQLRATQRYAPIEHDDEQPLAKRVIELASGGRMYEYRRITTLLNKESWRVNHKSVEGI